MPAAAELVVFPDAVDLACAAINEEITTRMPGVTAEGRVPSPRPKEFVRVRRAGGPRETLVTENATLLLEAYAGTNTRAAAILSLARAIMFAQDGQLFGVTDIGGPADLPDPTTSQERMTSMIGVRVRGTTLA